MSTTVGRFCRLPTRLLQIMSQNSSQNFIVSPKRRTKSRLQFIITLAQTGCGESFKYMKKFGLDSTDIRILCAVQQHGQLSKTKLAAIANISATPCWARLDRLKAAGFIRGYHGELALNKIFDFTQVVVTVSLIHHRKLDFDRFEAFILTHDEFTECIATGGGTDYVVRAICQNLTLFQGLMETMLAADLSIDRYMTYIVTRTIKTTQPNLTKLVVKESLPVTMSKKPTFQ